MSKSVHEISRKADSTQLVATQAWNQQQAGEGPADLFEEFSRILDKIAVQVQVDQAVPEVPATVALRPKSEVNRDVRSPEVVRATNSASVEQSPEASQQSERSEDEVDPASREDQDLSSETAREGGEQDSADEATAEVATKGAETVVQKSVVAAQVVTREADVPAQTAPDFTVTPEEFGAHQQAGPKLGSENRSQKSELPASLEQLEQSAEPVLATAPVAPTKVTPAAQVVAEGDLAAGDSSEMAAILKAVNDQLGLAKGSSRSEQRAPEMATPVFSFLAAELAHDMAGARGASALREGGMFSMKGGLGALDGVARSGTATGASELGFNRANDTASRNEATRAPRTLPRSAQVRTLEKVEAVLKEVAQSKDGKTISLRLDPPNLGSIKVDVSVRDNSLHARIVGESPAVVALLRERAFELQESLRKLGLDVDRITVAVEGRGEGAAHDGASGQQSGEGQRQEYSSGDGEQSRKLFEPSVLDVVSQIDDHWVA